MGEDARAVASIPRGEGLHGEFYTYCARHELRFQRCSACSAWRHMPRDRCARCGSDDWEWAVSNGKGLVLSWTVCHRAFHPSLDQALPYAVALVEFEPGARLIARLLDVDVETVCAGLGVEVCFEELAPGHVVPRVRPRSRSAP